MTKERQYLDFYLQLRDLDRLAKSFKVAVLPSPAVGESREATTVNYNYDELAKSLSLLEHRAIDQKSLIQLGEHLANLLLPPGEIRNLFEQVIKDAGQDGGVRLRLLTSEPELARLPWEYTYLRLNPGETGYQHFLVLNPQISLVRHEPIAKKHPKVEGIDPKQLRLLVAMANPKKDLNLEREKNNLTKVLEEFKVDGVTLEWQPLLENATINDLTNALMKKPGLFYFAGHGSFDQEGYILLQTDASGATYSMPASELGLQLKQAGVRVAVFGACESAQRDGTSEWAGVAPTLVAEGVPVVVAMQYEVLDNHAIAFSEIFYAALAAGLSVDEAVAAGRLAMLGQNASNQRKLSVVSESSDSESLSNEKPANVQWGVPVLYMGSADSIIFPRKTSAVAEQIRKVIQQNIGSIKNGSSFTGLKVKRAKGSFEFVLNIQEIDNSTGIGLFDGIALFDIVQNIQEIDNLTATGCIFFDDSGSNYWRESQENNCGVSTPEKSLLLVRYPNLDCPDRTIVNQPFSLFAQLLLKPLEQDSSTIQVEDTGTEELPKVEVVLRGRGFDFQGSNTQVMEVEREDDSEVRFILTPCQLGEQQVRVDFYQHGRRIGTVRRNILVAEQPVSTIVAQPKTALVIEMKPKPTIPAPDLELCIELNQRDGRTLSFTLHSTKEAIDFHHAKCGQVTLQGSPLDKMQAVYQDLSYLAAQPLITQGNQDIEQRKLLPVGSTSFASITQDSSERAKRRLTAVGNQLWDELIPNELKQQYWHFKYHVKSMLITSDEPWVPWEMIKPYRYSNGKEEQDPFWCQQFAISRWLSGPGTADDLPTKIVIPVAPFQSNLPSVKEEVTFLKQLSSLHSEISSLNTLSQGIELVDYLGANNEFSILHFACHGMFDGTLPNDSAIMLSDGSLRPSDIRLYFAPKSPRPLVFINACHGGRVGFSFTGLGGWAELLVKARVGAFVGAMWEVNDELALQFAKSFYKALLQDKKTIAEAFQYSREETRKLAPNNSTWLAYSLYADPEARVQDKKEIAETESMTGIRLDGY